MWHWIFLAFFIFSIIRFIIYLSERRIYQPYRRPQGSPRMPDYDSPSPAPRRPNSALVDISGEVRGETEKAYRFYDGRELCWLPKSQVEWDEDSGTMVCPEWLAKEKGLI